MKSLSTKLRNFGTSLALVATIGCSGSELRETYGEDCKEDTAASTTPTIESNQNQTYTSRGTKVMTIANIGKNPFTSNRDYSTNNFYMPQIYSLQTEPESTNTPNTNTTATTNSGLEALTLTVEKEITPNTNTTTKTKTTPDYASQNFVTAAVVYVFSNQEPVATKP
jgi:hypothetical protein